MSSPFPNIITVTGDLGSGKSHLCRLLSAHLGSTVVSTGTIQRDIAKELGLSTLELNKLSETCPDIDERIDGQMIALAGSENLICDSRLAWHFLPESFKICLKVSTEVAAGRVLMDKKRSGESYSSIEEATAALKARRQSEVLRFKQLYNVDCDDIANFDLVIDTSVATPEVIFDLILERIQLPKLPQDKGLLWLPPTTLFPTKDSDETASVEVIENEGVHCIYAGHRVVSEAVSQKQNWLPTELIADTEEFNAYAETNCTRERISAWETAHGFQFSKYPKWI
jgi:cytidylate kinase